MSQGSFQVETEFAGEDVILYVDYTYVPGYPATGPTYSSGGEPGQGPEIDIHSIECQPLKHTWERHAEGHLVKKTVPKGQRFTITGPVFALMADGDWLRELAIEDAEAFA